MKEVYCKSSRPIGKFTTRMFLEGSRRYINILPGLKYKFPSGLTFLYMSRKCNSREKKRPKIVKIAVGFNRTTASVWGKEFSVLRFA